MKRQPPTAPRLVLPDSPGATPATPTARPAEAPTPGQKRKWLPDWVHLPVLAAVVTGALMLTGNAVWQLWLSDVWGDYQQRQATEELALAEENPALVLPAGMSLAALSVAPPTTLTPTVTLPPQPPAPAGAPLGRITAPAAGVDATLVSGTTKSDLSVGPGWMAGTAFPGLPGNAVISGHRTTYGGPFRHIDRLKVGDRITVDVPQFGTTVFEVRDAFVVQPGDVWVAAPSGGVRLTLTTCHPAGSDKQRYVVQAEAVEGPGAAAATGAAEWVRSTPG